MRSIELTSQSYESQLVRRLRSGDRNAMLDLYVAHRNKLCTFIMARIGGDQSAAEDLVQEVFLVALTTADRYRGESQFYTWLRGIALHKINDLYRRKAREPRLDSCSSDTGEMNMYQIRSDEPTAATMVEQNEIRESVHHALVKLPRDYRRVLVLKYLDDKSVLEISRIMDRSPKAIDSLLYRARATLRSNMADHDSALLP